MTGMYMRLELRTVQKQEQKLELKQNITQKLTLEQYLDQEELIKTLIRYAYENNTWTTFDKDGFKFDYAKIPYELAKPIAKEYGYAFSHCMYDGWEALFNGRKYAMAQGDWVSFVVDDKTPKEQKELLEYFAIHERGEELSLGNHYFASQLEFGYAQKNKHTRKYIDFIDEIFPSKFVDLQEKVLFPILPEELIDIITAKEQSSQKQEELRLAEKIIKENPISPLVYKQIKKYSFQTDRVCKEISDCGTKLQIGIRNMIYGKDSNYTTQDIADYIDNTIRNTMKYLRVTDLKALSKPRISESIDTLMTVGLQDIRKNIKSKIIVEDNITKLIQKSKLGEALVRIEYTIEEQLRMNKE